MSELEAAEAKLRTEDVLCTPNSAASARHILSLSTQSRQEQVNALCHFCHCDLGNLVRCALVAGISADARDADGCPAICHAARRGSLKALQALLDGRADVNAAESSSGAAPLLLAVANSKLECVRALVVAGADARAAATADANTPLLEAIISKQLEAVRALLPVSDLAACNAEGRSALHLAVAGGGGAVFDTLLPLVTDVDLCTRRSAPGRAFDQTALHLACVMGRDDLVAALLLRRASWYKKDSEACTPLYYAAIYGHWSCLRLWLTTPS